MERGGSWETLLTSPASLPTPFFALSHTSITSLHHHQFDQLLAKPCPLLPDWPNRVHRKFPTAVPRAGWPNAGRNVPIGMSPVLLDSPYPGPPDNPSIHPGSQSVIPLPPNSNIESAKLTSASRPALPPPVSPMSTTLPTQIPAWTPTPRQLIRCPLKYVTLGSLVFVFFAYPNFGTN
jgi:hypothetical protein